MKAGRSQRDELVHVGFKADRATVEAIDILVATERRRGSMSPKGTAIRGALQEAARRQRALDALGNKER